MDRSAFLALGTAAGLAWAAAAGAMTLPEAIALAQHNNPGLAQVRAQADAAAARVDEATGARLPTVTISGQAAAGTTDLGGFFGFGRADVTPRGASVEVRQPLFTGGAITAGIERARQGRLAALAQVGGARALLSAQAAEAYVGVTSAAEVVALNDAQARQVAEIARQAALRFQAGEIPRTDLAQAQARLAQAQAGQARATGDEARARAHFQSVVGVAPDDLTPTPPPPPVPASLDAALAAAERNSPALQAAEASARGADAAVRFAQAERAPTLAATAVASTARDQFFPGYRADGVTVGVQGRWTVFSGGVVSGRIDEARAEARAARAGLEAARAQVREAVIAAWSDLTAARAMATAAKDQADAAASALDSVRNEVRVGQKPTLDLLDAEREALAADAALIAARGEAVSSAYRLRALLGDD